MQALLQRVVEARVSVENRVVGEIHQGLLVLLCAEQGDSEDVGQRLLRKVLTLRIFSDSQGKMNQSVLDVSGALLVVSQFTLAADTSKGNRPSFQAAAHPELARALYNAFVIQARQSGLRIETGEFGANMQVSLTNDGPVTIPLSSR